MTYGMFNLMERHSTRYCLVSVNRHFQISALANIIRNKEISKNERNFNATHSPGFFVPVKGNEASKCGDLDEDKAYNKNVTGYLKKKKGKN